MESSAFIKHMYISHVLLADCMLGQSEHTVIPKVEPYREQVFRYTTIIKSSACVDSQFRQ